MVILMETITIQAFIDNEWIDIAEISFPPEGGNTYQVTKLDYDFSYAAMHYEKDDQHAVSVNYPVAFFVDQDESGWLKFIDDIMPSGSSRRYWVELLDIGALPIHQQNFILLKFGTISPIGNLRIKESVGEVTKTAIQYFTIDEVKNRVSDFLSYAQSRGAAAGGATGAGGEAPKLLLRCDKDKRVWIDTYQDDAANLDDHYLVKFPRGSRSNIDCDILRAEFYYYHELQKMGFDTIATDNMWLVEGDNYPSLWLPRFDITVLRAGEVRRSGMESVYSMLKASPGAMLSHGETINKLVKIIKESHTVTAKGLPFDVENFVIEWVRRDLLNIIFGNSDNHGRNTSFLKDENGIRLSPIYDFAPMKADAEGVIRTITWGVPLEVGGEYQFKEIALSLSDFVNPDVLFKELKVTAQQLLGLKERLRARGVPKSIIDMPTFGFDYIEDKMEKWGLL